MPDLAAIVDEIERQLAAEGWDQPPRLYALVNTGELLANEPQLAEMLTGSDPDGLTPVEQAPIEEDLADLLGRIEWPPLVLGAAVVDEVVLLPDGATEARPAEADEYEWAAAHPEHRDVRMVVAVLRDGTRAATIRVRGVAGADDERLSAPDLVPNLAAALLDTFGPEQPG
jgi:hypothetical protein